MIISNDEKRIRTWVELNEIELESISKWKLEIHNDMKQLLKIIDNLRLGCPFDRKECNLHPEDPCPVCGDIDDGNQSNCIHNMCI